MRGTAVFRLIVVLATALVLQASLLSEVRIAGVAVDLLLVLAIAAGLTGGPDRGAVVGFVAGFGIDLLLQTPFGLSALSYAVAGYVAGVLHSAVVRSSWWIPVLIAVACAALGLGVFVLGGEVMGESLLLTPHLDRILLVVVAATGVLVLPVSRLLRWVWHEQPGSRPAIT